MAEHGTAKRARMDDEQWQRDQTAFGTVLVPGAMAASAGAPSFESMEWLVKALRTTL